MDEPEHKDKVVEAIDLHDERGEGATEAEILVYLMEEHGMEKDDVKDALEESYMAGYCYSPSGDNYRTI